MTSAGRAHKKPGACRDEWTRMLRRIGRMILEGETAVRFLRIAVLLISLCAAAPVWALADGQSVGVTAQERYNINLFLSNFSEQGMTHYDKACTTDAQL